MSWSRPAPGRGPWPAPCWPPTPPAPRRCATSWSSGPPPSAGCTPPRAAPRTRLSPPGPSSATLAALPRTAGPAVVVANELLDNLPFGLAERRDGTWGEVRVDLDRSGRLFELVVPLADEGSALLDRVGPGE